MKVLRRFGSVEKGREASFKVFSEVLSILVQLVTDHPSLLILLVFAICFFKEVF